MKLYAVLTLLALCATVANGAPIPKQAAKKFEGSPLLWYDIRKLGVEGRGWDDTKEYYDRLPAKAEGVVRPPVWGLSRHSAGMQVRFVTDADFIAARWTVRSASLAMDHMPATGVSGLDLYARDDGGRWRWLGVGRPHGALAESGGRTFMQTLIGSWPRQAREFRLYLPLYNGVTEVFVGLREDAQLETAPPYPAGHEKPIVFYGTSITHGGCVSRPGMAYPSIIGRHLERPIINLGFSGNGKMDREVADLLAELDPCLYFIDCLPNMNAQEVAERTEPMVRILRAAHPDTPIVLVEDRTYANTWLIPGRRRRHDASRTALRAAFQRLQAAGVTKLFYIPGEGQLGEDNEDTVDGSHPTDLGHLRMARVFEKTLLDAGLVP